MNSEFLGIYLSELESQDFNSSIIKYANEHNINVEKSSLQITTFKNHKTIDRYIEKLPYNSEIFIDTFMALGNSIFYILKRINDLKNKNITLHVLDKNLTLHLRNDLLFQVLESLLEVEISKIQHRTDTAKLTRDKKNIKLGRKKGTKVKSKYDPHKKRIMHLHMQGVPNTKIITDIGIGTAQSLGKYIKQIKLAKKRKEQAKGTYLLTKEDLENINKLDS